MTAQNSDISIEGFYDFYPSVTFNVLDKKITFYVPSKTTLWRCNTFMTSEPETIEWISAFKKGEILMDIGANVGMYSIWAAITAGVRVYAFEPESKNYAILTENIRLNDLQRSVTAFCAAIGDQVELGELFLGQTVAGGSGHTYGQETDHNLQPMSSPFRQGCISFTLDTLIENGSIPCPDHIKVDVDGIEHKVTEGFLKTLENNTLKSVLIELNTHLEEHRSIISKFTDMGFKLREDILKTSLNHNSDVWDGIGNHIFYRS